MFIICARKMSLSIQFPCTFSGEKRLKALSGIAYTLMQQSLLRQDLEVSSVFVLKLHAARVTTKLLQRIPLPPISPRSRLQSTDCKHLRDGVDIKSDSVP